MCGQAETFQVQFGNIVRCSGHTLSQIRLLMVLKGKVMIESHGQSRQIMQKGDVQVINPNTDWRMTSEHDNIVVIIDLSPLWLFNRSDDLAHHRFHISTETPPQIVKQMAHLLCQIATLWLKKSSETWALEVNKSLLELFCLLLQNAKEQRSDNYSGAVLSPRITQAVAWIEEHYQQNVSLQQLARRLHVSNAHLSRQFTQETGTNFRNRLTQVRLRQAARLLALSNQTVNQIVSESGFSSLQRFNRLFRERFSMSPGSWRTGVKAGRISLQDHSDSLNDEAGEEMKKVSSIELFSLLVQDMMVPQVKPRESTDLRREHILLSPGTSQGKIRIRQYVIAVDSFSELLKQHVQQQLWLLKRSIHTFAVEVSDPIVGGLDGETVMTGEIPPTWSPWSNLDLACQFLQTLNVAPVIRIELELGELSFRAYSVRLKEFIQHNRLLLGDEYVQRWIFILDIDKSQMLKVDKRAALCERLFSLIRNMLPDCRIGIAWRQAHENGHFLPTNLYRQADFICIVVAPNDNYDNSSSPNYSPLENQHIIHQQIEELMQHLRRQGISRPLYLQSWSTLTGNMPMTNGLFFRGALLMDTLLSLQEEVSMLGLWLNSALQNEFRSENSIENNSISLFFNANTRRPIFHILALRQRIGEEFFASGPGWVATRQGAVISLLLLNPVTINPQLSVQQHLMNDYCKLYTIQLALPETGTWRIKKWLFNQKNGALYYQYGLQPTRYDRDAETMAYINQRSEPTLRVTDERLNSQWIAEQVLDINAVCLFQLYRIAE